MKTVNNNLLYILMLITFSVASLISCTDDDYINVVEPIQGFPNMVKANVCAIRSNFDSSLSNTRAGNVSTVWNDSTVIYLLFTRANGSTTTGQAVYSEDNDEWTITYNQSLARNEQTKCIAYYFDGTITKEGNTVKLNATNGVYVDSTASYIFPSNGMLSITCKLHPITSRIRFVGDVGNDQLLVDGLRHYTEFSLDDFSLRSDLSQIGLNKYNGTDYIYGLWETEEKQELALSHNFCRFTNDFTGMHILQKGKSGKIDLPTKENHNGWVMHDIPHDVIDLGLSVYWRVENLGVKVEKYRPRYSNECPTPPLKSGWYCKWGDPNATNKEKKYDFELECLAGNPLYDAAALQYGDGWSIPTSEQWEELLSKCKISFHRVYSGIYILGYAWCELQGPNGNKMIFSYNGERDTPSRNEGSWEDERNDGFFWTSDRVKGGYPKCVQFCVYSEEAAVIEKRDVKYLNIRPVYKKD